MTDLGFDLCTDTHYYKDNHVIIFEKITKKMITYHEGKLYEPWAHLCGNEYYHNGYGLSMIDNNINNTKKLYIDNDNRFYFWKNHVDDAQSWKNSLKIEKRYLDGYSHLIPEELNGPYNYINYHD